MKRLSALLLSIVVFAVLAVGCQPAKKPARTPQNPQIPQTSPTPRTTPPAPARRMAPGQMPTTSAETNKLAEKLATEAEKVQGVENASVVFTGNTAYVGFDADKTAPRGTSEKVADRVKRADKRLTRVYATSDVRTVSKIRRVAQGIANGRVVTDFAADLTEIGRRINPVAKSK